MILPLCPPCSAILLYAERLSQPLCRRPNSSIVTMFGSPLSILNKPTKKNKKKIGENKHYDMSINVKEET